METGSDTQNPNTFIEKEDKAWKMALAEKPYKDKAIDARNFGLDNNISSK